MDNGKRVCNDPLDLGPQLSTAAMLRALHLGVIKGLAADDIDFEFLDDAHERAPRRMETVNEYMILACVTGGASRYLAASLTPGRVRMVRAALSALRVVTSAKLTAAVNIAVFAAF